MSNEVQPTMQHDVLPTLPNEIWYDEMRRGMAEETWFQRKTRAFKEITKTYTSDFGGELSKKEREEKGVMMDNTLVYGEIEFEAMKDVFESIVQNHGGLQGTGVFYDLGSGTGKVWVGAALLHPFAIVVGIEIIQSLYEASLELKPTYSSVMEEYREKNPEELLGIPVIEFLQGDFMKGGFEDADVIYLNSCWYTQEMMDIIGEFPLKPGTLAISVSRNFENSPSWEILECVMREMSWCPTDVYVSRKKQNQQKWNCPTQYNKMESNLLESIYSQVCDNYTADLSTELSNSERHERVNKEDHTLVYGEIEFQTMADVFTSIQQNHGGMGNGVFYDLGSGSGKAWFAAALLHPFSEVYGIELLKSLYDLSVQLLQNFKETVATSQEKNPSEIITLPIIEFFHGDFFQIDVSSADIIYVNLIAQELVDAIGELPFKPGTLAITITRHFQKSSNWEVLEYELRDMSWCPSLVYVSRRL